MSAQHGQSRVVLRLRYKAAKAVDGERRRVLDYALYSGKSRLMVGLGIPDHQEAGTRYEITAP